MFVAIVIVSNLAITSEAHVGHIPSNINVEIFVGSVANIGWISLFTIHCSAPVTPGQKVTCVVEFVQNRSGSSSQSWKVAPATVAPDFRQSDWNVTFAWWAVVPHFSIVTVGPNSAVGQVVDNRFVNVLWNSVSHGFRGERIDETDLSLRGVGGVDVLFVEVDELGFGESSKLTNVHWC
jgi:hypothetical protein